MKKQFHILLIFLLATANICLSQSIEDIKDSRDYLWGYAEAENLPQANKLALDDLISQVSVQVESEFVNILEENRDGEQHNLEEYTRVVIKTYAQASLQGYQRIVDEKRNSTRVLLYLKKDDLTKIFAERKMRIFDYTANAVKAERSLAIGDALRNYYYALILLRSHPEMNSIRYLFPDSVNAALLVAIPQRMDAILRGIVFNLEDIDEYPDQNRKDLILSITCDGQPVQNLDYRYFNGFDYSVIESASDGRGVLELVGEQSRTEDRVRIFVEYEYENMIGSDPELKNVKTSTIPPPFFACSEKWVQVAGKLGGWEAETGNSKQETRNSMGEVGNYTEVVEGIIASIRSGQFEDVRSHFTIEGYNMFDTLIRMGNVKVLPVSDSLKIIRLNDETMVRSVPMRFSYQNNQRQFVENVVFFFNNENKISALSFGLGDKAVSDIISQSERWGTREEKYQLIRFMENYKTAYCMKRLDYIESIFADNALIIVGRVLKEAEPIDNMYLNLGNDHVRYVKYNKETYIKNLRANFARNEFVNIHFEDNKVLRKSGDDKIYGIQIAQHYYSSTYSDFGYLFLMIDLNDSLNPKIYVRTWQPQKNPDGSIYGLEDFYF